MSMKAEAVPAAATGRAVGPQKDDPSPSRQLESNLRPPNHHGAGVTIPLTNRVKRRLNADADWLSWPVRLRMTVKKTKIVVKRRPKGVDDKQH
jgi:hypothetical protein